MIKLGIIENILSNGGLKVIIDGEDLPRQKELSPISSYDPKIGDRVALARQGEDYIVLGDIKELNGDTSTAPDYSWDRYSLLDEIEEQEYIENHTGRWLYFSPTLSTQYESIDGFNYYDWDTSGNGYKVTDNSYGYLKLNRNYDGSYYYLEHRANGIYFTSTKKKIYVSKKIKGALIERVTSKIRDAYPDGGEKNGYWYEFKG